MSRVRHLTSRDNPLLVQLRRLAAQPAGYRREGRVWLEGEHLCEAYVRRGGVPELAVIEEDAWEAGDTLCALAGHAANVAVVPAALMASLSTLESPAPIGVAIAWPGAGVLRSGEPTVVLDRLQDAGNVGSILRSAAAFGVRQVAAIKGTAALWSPKVLRAGMGAHFGLHLVEGLEAVALDALGAPLLATSSHAGQSIHEAALPWPCAWVFGHEGQGVDDKLLGMAAHTLRIPQPGGEESLNVAAAAAVCLYASAAARQ